MRKGMPVAFSILVFIMLFSQAAFGDERIDETKINATAERHLIFLVPRNQMIEEGKEETNIGVTGIKELLLFSDETLKIVLIPDGEMRQIDGKGSLHWEISCEELPVSINTAGEWYVTVNIKKYHWQTALPGSYKGAIRFEVYSSISQELLLSRSTTLETIVNNPSKNQPIDTPRTGVTNNVLWYTVLFGLSALYLIVFASSREEWLEK